MNLEKLRDVIATKKLRFKSEWKDEPLTRFQFLFLVEEFIEALTEPYEKKETQ